MVNIKEGEWHHLVIVLNRQVLKNSSFSLFVNGQHIATQKMQFICPAPGGGGGLSSGNLTMASSVFAYIGKEVCKRSVIHQLALKVRQFLNEFMKSSFLPKYEPGFLPCTVH